MDSRIVCRNCRWARVAKTSSTTVTAHASLLPEKGWIAVEQMIQIARGKLTRGAVIDASERGVDDRTSSELSPGDLDHLLHRYPALLRQQAGVGRDGRAARLRHPGPPAVPAHDAAVHPARDLLGLVGPVGV